MGRNIARILAPFVVGIPFMFGGCGTMNSSDVLSVLYRTGSMNPKASIQERRAMGIISDAYGEDGKRKYQQGEADRQAKEYQERQEESAKEERNYQERREKERKIQEEPKIIKITRKLVYLGGECTRGECSGGRWAFYEDGNEIDTKEENGKIYYLEECRGCESGYKWKLAEGIPMFHSSSGK